MTSRLLHVRGERLLPAVLSTTAGAVDAIGFLAFGGLFTAHITGNVVILAAHYVIGGFSEIGPLLAVPVFMAVLGLVTAASVVAARTGLRPRRGLLALHGFLLAVCLALGVAFGPFPDAERPLAVFVGMLAVAAMAVQNALVKLALPGSPSTAVMTTNLTQMTVDLTTLVCGLGTPDDLARVRNRVGAILPCVVGFVCGCAVGAILEVHFALWSLMLPVVLAVFAVGLGEIVDESTDTGSSTR
jgi:uncharacterized membrane protein YoaK (UPF0700 family)